ncbi:CLUMA_CG009978, isoform A [Clunio marinus]|uniref:CLUMA_CG009978, isoform A n=1 Tax=Clunio marinus TaxID=568069 RepID=A0A1J1I8S9_9DIPT|nr:CLUMA_CG009978, isoform A [Clunio marinus]
MSKSKTSIFLLTFLLICAFTAITVWGFPDCSKGESELCWSVTCPPPYRLRPTGPWGRQCCCHSF